MKILLIFLVISSTFLGSGIEQAEKYNKNSQLQWDLAINFIKKIPFSFEDTILDIGCGDGKITALIADICTPSHILGTDISSAMINFAQRHYIESNLSFIQVGVEDLSFIGEFSKVVSFSALHWVIDQEKAFRKIYQSLIPGGKVYILTYGRSPMNISALAEKLIYSEKWKNYFPSYKATRIYLTQEECYSCLEKVGFLEIDVKQKTERLIYPNRQTFIDFIEPLLSFTSHLPEELKKQFVQEIVDEVIGCKISSKSEEILFELNSLQISAKKN